MSKEKALREAGARYTKALTAFVSEANEKQHMAALVEALTWTLARSGHRGGDGDRRIARVRAG
jgi:hypothetical protein